LHPRRSCARPIAFHRPAVYPRTAIHLGFPRRFAANGSLGGPDRTDAAGLPDGGDAPIKDADKIYPTVGHSFFRQDLGTIATREIADAWDRVTSFLRRSFA
jgi:dienelactone hydrolase